MEINQVRKYCIVPYCFNSTVKTPDKRFFYVPLDPKIRKKWMTAVKRVDSIGPKTKAHCCEDHFDVENDMENYIKYKLVGGKLKLKQGVVPHKFACHKQTVEKHKRSVLKIVKIETLTTSSSECTASTSHDVDKMYIVDSNSIPRVQYIGNDHPLKDGTRDENLRNTTKDVLKTKHTKKKVNLRNNHKSTEAHIKHFHLPSPKKKQYQHKKKKPLHNNPSTSSFEESLISAKQSTYSDYYDVLDETDITHSEADFDKEVNDSPCSSTATRPEQTQDESPFELPKASDVIANVYAYLKNEYETLKSSLGDSCDLRPLADILQRTAQATGVGQQTVIRVLRKRKRSQGSAHEATPEKRPKVSKNVIDEVYNSSVEEYSSSESADENQLEDDNKTEVDEGGQTEQVDPVIETLKIELKEEHEDHSEAVKEVIRQDPVLLWLHDAPPAAPPTLVQVKVEPPDEQSTDRATPIMDVSMSEPTHADVKSEPPGP